MIVDDFSVSQVWTPKDDFTYIVGHHLICHLVNIFIGDHKFKYALEIYPHLDIFMDPPQWIWFKMRSGLESKSLH